MTANIIKALKYVEGLQVHVPNMVSLRQNLHTIAEGGFDCFNTQKLLKKTLLDLGF